MFFNCYTKPTQLRYFIINLNPNVLTVFKITFSRKGKNVIDHVMLFDIMSFYVILNLISINKI